MGNQPSGGQQLSIEAVLPTNGGEHSTEGEQPQTAEESARPVVSGELAATTGAMLAELGRRIGEVEGLVSRFPEHEGRVASMLDEQRQRADDLGESIRAEVRQLAELFGSHTHDAPREPEPKVSEIVDNPIQTVEHALTTPEAPPADEVQAPPALKNTRVYRSRLFRDR